jgi:hypothetical protein
MTSIYWHFEIDSALQPNQASPRQLVVPDVDEPFLPLPPSALFVDPHQSRCASIFYRLESGSMPHRPRAVIESLLDNLQQRQASLPPGATSHSCLGSALRASLDALVCARLLYNYDRPYDIVTQRHTLAAMSCPSFAHSRDLALADWFHLRT